MPEKNNLDVQFNLTWQKYFEQGEVSTKAEAFQKNRRKQAAIRDVEKISTKTVDRLWTSFWIRAVIDKNL